MTNTTPTPSASTTPSTASATAGSAATGSAATASRTSASAPSLGAGKTEINDAVVAKVAGIAAREVRGVHTLGGTAGRAIGALRDRVGQTNLSQGISVEVGETQVAVDVTLTAEYPVSLQDVADDVRNAITKAIEDIVGMEVAEVNVTIADVYIASDDDDTDESRVK